MKNVLRLTTMFVVLLMSVSVFAQTDQKIAKNVEREVKAQANVMKLDSVQQNKLTVVLTTYYKDRREAKQLEGKERGAKMKEAKKKMNDGMSAVCTPEQLDAWKKHQAATAKPKEPKKK